MSALAQSVEIRDRSNARPRATEYHAVVALATAEDVAAGMERVVELAQHASGAARVEWWADDRLAAHQGVARGPSRSVELGRGGELVFYGGTIDLRLRTALVSLAPILRRRLAEERLAQAAVELARRNEALEDFAALVAHELKAPLHAALVADDPAGSVEQALELVDTLLLVARDDEVACAGDVLRQAIDDLPALDLAVTSDLEQAPPLPAAPLRVILRNLLANAASAGARSVHVAAEQSQTSWRLYVDDDGVGLSDDGYAAGSGLGLGLCRRIAARFGGALELEPGRSGGARATLVLGKAS